MTDRYNAPWPPLPEGVTGQEVRYRDCRSGTRLGLLEPKVIVAETDHWVVLAVYSAKGKFLCEEVLSKARFENEFERRDGRKDRVEAFLEGLRELTREHDIVIGLDRPSRRTSDDPLFLFDISDEGSAVRVARVVGFFGEPRAEYLGPEA